MGARGEVVTGTGSIAVGYGCGTDMVVVIEVFGERKEEVDVELIDVVLTAVKVA